MASTESSTKKLRRLKVGRTATINGTEIAVTIVEIRGNEVSLLIEGSTVIEVLPAVERVKQRKFGRVD